MFRTIIVVGYIAIFLIISLPILPFIKLAEKRNYLGASRFAQGTLRYICKNVVKLAGADLEIHGRENIPKDTPVLFAGNHSSYFDIICTLCQDLGPFGYIAKQELGKVPSLNIWMLRMNCLFLNRKDVRAGMQVILDAIENIKRGISVFVFPEGTRSKDGSVHEFKGGSFKIAIKTGCPIIPVSIKGTADLFENHVPYMHPSKVIIRFGEPIYMDSLSKEEKKTLGEITRTKVIEQLSLDDN